MIRVTLLLIFFVATASADIIWFKDGRKLYDVRVVDETDSTLTVRFYNDDAFGKKETYPKALIANFRQEVIQGNSRYSDDTKQQKPESYWYNPDGDVVFLDGEVGYQGVSKTVTLGNAEATADHSGYGMGLGIGIPINKATFFVYGNYGTLDADITGAAASQKGYSLGLKLRVYLK